MKTDLKKLNQILTQVLRCLRHAQQPIVFFYPGKLRLTSPVGKKPPDYRTKLSIFIDRSGEMWENVVSCGLVVSSLPAPNGMSEKNPSGKVRGYYSCFDFSMDEKRRVPVPARWRTADVENEFYLILWNSNGDAGACVRVYSPEQMDSLINKVKAMSTSDAGAVALRRDIGENCEPVMTDKQGRIRLTEHLANAAGIVPGQQVKLAGLVDWFEIWNPERHKIARQQDARHSLESIKHI